MYFPMKRAGPGPILSAVCLALKTGANLGRGADPLDKEHCVFFLGLNLGAGLTAALLRDLAAFCKIVDNGFCSASTSSSLHGMLVSVFSWGKVMAISTQMVCDARGKLQCLKEELALER